MFDENLSFSELKVVLIDSTDRVEMLFISMVDSLLKNVFGIDLEVVFSGDLGENYKPVFEKYKTADIFFVGYSLSDNDNFYGSEIASYLRGLCPESYIVGWINDEWDDLAKMEKAFSKADEVVDKKEGLRPSEFSSLIKRADRQVKQNKQKTTL